MQWYDSPSETDTAETVFPTIDHPRTKPSGSGIPGSGMTLLAWLSRYADLTPDRPCLVHHQNGRYAVMTYSDVHALAGQASKTLTRALAEAPARHRTEAGSGSGQTGSDIVLLFLKHHPLQLPAYLGTMMAGLVPSFMAFPTPKQDPAHYWASHAELVARIQPALIVTYPEIASEVETLCADLPTKVLLIDDLATGDGPSATVIPGPSDTALLQHSSGTTGLKKGVVLTFGQIEAQATAYAPTIDLGPGSTVVSWLPYYHDMGLFTAFLIPLTVGATVVSMDAFEWVARPAILFETIERFQGTHCWLPNFAFQHLVNTVPSDGAAGQAYRLDSMIRFISCSEPVKAASLVAFSRTFAAYGIRPEHLSACYAMAETGFAVSQSNPTRHDPVRWYAGRPSRRRHVPSRWLRIIPAPAPWCRTDPRSRASGFVSCPSPETRRRRGPREALSSVRLRCAEISSSPDTIGTRPRPNKPSWMVGTAPAISASWTKANFSSAAGSRM